MLGEGYECMCMYPVRWARRMFSTVIICIMDFILFLYSGMSVYYYQFICFGRCCDVLLACFLLLFWYLCLFVVVFFSFFFLPNLTQLHTNEITGSTIRSDLYDALRFSVLASFCCCLFS